VRRSLLFLTLGAILALPACSRTSDGPVAPPSKGVVVATTSSGRATLNVEIADTEALRDNGLMGRTSLSPDSGMAFLWSSPSTSSFWMKDTLIPLSIAFWDSTGKVVAIDEMKPCTSDPCETFGAPVAYVGAAEANAGWFGEHGVKVGDNINLTRTPKKEEG
jgi:uncharacterized membrane protein (UPF0127 family)